MNLNSAAFVATRAVTPPVGANLLVSLGYTTGANGKQIPTYDAPAPVTTDVQPLSRQDLRHLDALNITGVERAAYLNGTAEGVNRDRGKGGDLLVFGADVPTLTGTWLIMAVLESWDTPGWVKVGMTLQVTP
jgi:hypothetical protein